MFELDFASVIDYQNPNGASTHSLVKATNIPIELSSGTLILGLPNLQFQGGGPLDYVEHSSVIPPGECTETLDHTEEGWLHVDELKLQLDLNLFTRGTSTSFPSMPPRITMRFVYDPVPNEIYNIICEDGQTSVETDLWWGFFDILHMEELTDYEGFVIKNWTYNYGSDGS